MTRPRIYPDIKNCAKCGNYFRVNPLQRRIQKCCSTECARAIMAQGCARRAAEKRIARAIEGRRA